MLFFVFCRFLCILIRFNILLCNKHQSGLPVVVEAVTETVEAVAEEFAGVVVEVAVEVVVVAEVVKVVRGLFVALFVVFGSS